MACQTCEPRLARSVQEPLLVLPNGVGPPGAFLPKPPVMPPQPLSSSVDDVTALLLKQKSEIAKLAEQQDSLTRLVEEHMNSLRDLIEKRQTDICDIIDLRFKELPAQIHPFGIGAAPGKDLEASMEHGLTNCTAGLAPTSPTGMRGSRKRQLSPGIPRPEETPEDTEQPQQPSGILERLKTFISSPLFEIIMGTVIVLNITSIFIQLQWKGYHSAFALGLGTTDRGYPEAEKVFDKLELVFNSIYLTELMLRLWVKRLRYFCDVMGSIDAVVVVVCCLQSFILEPAQLSLEESLVRLVRLFRLFRIIKIFRFMNQVEELRILLRTLSLSAGSLLWSMLLIGVIIIAAGVLMAQLTLSFIEDESEDLEIREWVYTQYGSAGRATFTMFEGAFTAVWTAKSEPLIENVTFGYGFLYVAYVVTINFAMIRVISALFLKQTMAVASMDAEKRAVQKMQERAKYMERVREFFNEQDVSGDGVLDEDEFNHMLRTEEVKTLFEMLELREDEARMLFEVLSGEDGVVDYVEFLDGAMKMKNSSRAIESIQVLHEVTVLQRRMDNMSSGFQMILDVVRPKSVWDQAAAPRRTARRSSILESTPSQEDIIYLMG